MCGILGFVSNDASEKIETLKAMMRVQQHRGPDEQGLYTSNRCILGHNRLSIVDLGTGQQPMSTTDGRYTIVFNGEIYGFKRIKKTLNYPFTTHSDTEVILAMYVEYGHKLLDLLPGMFSLAIWDNLKEELFVARDRVGEKPFYYAVTDTKEFIFASEIKTIVATNLIDLTIDMRSVAHFLSKLYVHPNHSIYKNINSLPAGHFGIFKNQTLEIHRYWNPSHFEQKLSYMEAIEQLDYLFTHSIKDQLIADVPVSVFLSGGLDSSTVAAYAVKENASIEALSFRFTSGFDEGPFAQAVAKMHKINIKELWEEEKIDVVDLFKKSIACYDEPFADSSSIPTMLICQAAVKNSKVVLSGDGADELFGGYVGRYRPGVYMEKMLGKSRARIAAARLIYGLANKMIASEQTHCAAIATKFLMQNKNIVEGVDYSTSIFKDDELIRFGLNRQLPILPDDKSSVNAGMSLDLLNYLPGDILVKTDRAAMAVGLEVRSPFLAKEIIEFAIGLPGNFKITKDSDKRLMRDTFSAVLPTSVKKRSKQGFGSPVKAWLNHSSLKEFRRESFSKNSKIYSLLDQKLIDANKDDDGLKGWALLTLAAWLNCQ
jgi:asparagine synthase (glutamine-hydrolysing)